MIYAFKSRRLVVSKHGWRYTFLDAKGEPVASFWGTSEREVVNAARLIYGEA